MQGMGHSRFISQSGRKPQAVCPFNPIISGGLASRGTQRTAGGNGLNIQLTHAWQRLLVPCGISRLTIPDTWYLEPGTLSNSGHIAAIGYSAQKSNLKVASARVSLSQLTQLLLTFNP